MKSRICQLFQSQPTFNPKKQAHILAYSHLTETQKAHGRILKLGISAAELSVVGCNCESKAFWDAYQVFDEVSKWDVVSASAMISRFARCQRHKETVYLFSRMLMLNIRPNEFTFGTVINSSISLSDLNSGKQLHGCATKLGLQSNVFVGSAILDLYAKLSSIEEAQRAFEDTHEPNVVSYTSLICGYLKKERFDDARWIFQAMPERNVVSWNAMIAGYSQMGHNEDAVNLFIHMLREGLVPNQSTFPCAISAAANIAALGMGRSFHACAIKSLGNLGVFVSNSLNSLICSYAQNGRGKEALDFFQEMQSLGPQPNSVTLLGVLLACNHVGLIEEGYSYINQARLKNPSMLRPEHYACMVDLLSRSGNFQEAERFICDLPFDLGIGFWKAFLGGCQIHSNMELGELAARKIQALDPRDVSSFVMLSNAHSAVGRWQCVNDKTRNERKGDEKGSRVQLD
ncbi:hypothetical protein U1Q18_042587 [Sarracenia purpurea var. burkii]